MFGPRGEVKELLVLLELATDNADGSVSLTDRTFMCTIQAGWAQTAGHQSMHWCFS